MAVRAMGRFNPGAIGTPAELAVRGELREAGYLVASRRHEPGPGDELGVRPGEIALLVETKATKDLPWRSDFGPAERKAMTSVYFVEPILAWRIRYQVPGERRWQWGTCWLPPEDWPGG